MRCQRFQEMMVESLYDELDDVLQKQLDAHLAECEQCATEFEAMSETLVTMNRRQRRDPGQAYWDGYWDRLSERMQDEPVAVTPSSQSWWRRDTVSPRRWAYRAAAAAAILTVGVFAGRTFFAPEFPVSVGEEPIVAEHPVDNTTANDDQAPVPSEQVADHTAGTQESTPSTPPAEATTERGEPTYTPPPASDGGTMDVLPASSDRAMRYVEKSQMLLVALVNNDPSASDGYVADYAVQRERSRQLVNEGAEIKDELSDPKQRRLRELVAELQKILLQIANLESDEDMDAVEFIRSRVNEHDMLLKINLEQMRQGTGVDGSTSGTAPGSNSQRSI